MCRKTNKVTLDKFILGVQLLPAVLNSGTRKKFPTLLIFCIEPYRSQIRILNGLTGRIRTWKHFSYRCWFSNCSVKRACSLYGWGGGEGEPPLPIPSPSEQSKFTSSRWGRQGEGEPLPPPFARCHLRTQDNIDFRWSPLPVAVEMA